MRRTLRLLAIFVGVALCTIACSRQPPAASTTSTPVQGAKGPDPSKDLAYVCPMDPDMRSNQPGTCPRCGMALVAGIPEPREFHVDLETSPRAPRPNEPVQLTFTMFDP